MSALQDYLKKIESEVLPGNIDTEKDESETAAVVTENEKSHYVSVGRSKLRPVAEPTDKKYAGKKVTREELEQDSENEDSEDGEDYDDDFSDNEEEAALLAKMNSGAKVIEEEKEEEEEDMSKYFLGLSFKSGCRYFKNFFKSKASRVKTKKIMKMKRTKMKVMKKEMNLTPLYQKKWKA